MSVAQLSRELQTGVLTPREATQAYLDRIEQVDGEINAYITVRGDQALAEAAALARAEERGPLWGVPIAIKDVIDVAGTRTTAASAILADNVPARDALTVERLRQAGAVILGKLNTHEFAFGATTTSPHFGPSRNPWSTDRVCGGSSGGSGAAAAADLAAGTLGTDTAGSIRIPACLCGITGLRPSSGLVPNHGVVPVSWTFDTVGPVARSAEDCAFILDAIAHTTATTSLNGGVKGLRIGVVEALFDLAEPRIAAAARACVDTLIGGGATAEPVEVPMLVEAGTINQLRMLPEAASVHLEWMRTRLEEYGADVRARLLAGLFLPATAYVTGMRARRVYMAGIDRLFERFDLLVAPAMPVIAPRLDQNEVEMGGEVLAYRLAIIPFNSPWSLAGLPILNVPSGAVDGMPVGVSLVGRRLGEETVLRAGHAFQQATDWHERRPGGAV